MASRCIEHRKIPVKSNWLREVNIDFRDLLIALALAVFFPTAGILAFSYGRPRGAYPIEEEEGTPARPRALREEPGLIIDHHL